MYALVDLLFVINRNWELWAPAIPHGFLGLEISISITLLETTDLVHADLILFTSIESLPIIHAISLRGRRNPPPINFWSKSKSLVSGFPTNQCEIEYSQNGVRDETSASFSEFSYWSKQDLRLFCSAKT